jgi:hypoxanthine phosphoribosyltransferase
MEQTITIKDRQFTVFFSEQQLQTRIAELAQLISSDLKDKDPLFISVLNGAFMFTSDLLKGMTFPCQVSFIKVASYHGGTTSSGTINSLMGLSENLAERHIVLVEDIIDTGLTMQYLLEQLELQEPASITIATLLLKKEALKVPIHPQYIGFEVPHTFLVGYGLDYDGYGRNLRHIYGEVR